MVRFWGKSLILFSSVFLKVDNANIKYEEVIIVMWVWKKWEALENEMTELKSHIYLIAKSRVSAQFF